MTFPVFAPGDVLAAADMNAVGLWKIGGATFTTVSAVSLPTGTFTDDYDNYRVVFDISAVAADADFTARMRASGSDNTAEQYAVQTFNLSNATVTGVSGGNATSWSIGESDNSTVQVQYVFEFYRPFTTDQPKKSQIYGTFTDKAGTSNVIRFGRLRFNVSTAMDSFSFISTQNISGRYFVYGYR